jgi:hypothetical protein
MNFDTCKEPAKLRNQAADKLQSSLPKPVRHPVKYNGMEPLIQDNHLKTRPRSGVSFKKGIQIGL